MTQQIGPGPQLPPDSTGKVTGAYPVTVNGVTVYVPATVWVNSEGYEIGQAILDRLAENGNLLTRCLTALALIAGEMAQVNPDELLIDS